MWFECASDNILIGRDRPAVDEIREFRMSPSNDQDVQEVWGVMYQNVAKANNIIKLVPDLGITPSVKKLALGSCLFLPRLLDALDGSLLRRRYETAAFPSSSTRRPWTPWTRRVRTTC